jgi:peptidoglycan hydrolase CwlO-like protein
MKTIYSHAELVEKLEIAQRLSFDSVHKAEKYKKELKKAQKEIDLLRNQVGTLLSQRDSLADHYIRKEKPEFFDDITGLRL